MRATLVGLMHFLRLRSFIYRAKELLHTKRVWVPLGSCLLTAFLLFLSLPIKSATAETDEAFSLPSQPMMAAVPLMADQRPSENAVPKSGTATILFTFDDGPASDYLLAYPILKQYGIRGTSYLATQFTDANTIGKLTWAQVKEMRAYGWVFGCHTYEHRHMADMSNKEIQRSMELVNQSFKRQGLPAPNILAFPYGSYNKRVINAIKPYRAQARLAYYQTKFVDMSYPYEVNSISADMRTERQLKKVMKIVDKACREHAVVVFRVHTLYKQRPYDTVKINEKIRSGCAPQTDSRLFKQLVRYCVDKGCSFMTMEELRQRMEGLPTA